MGFFVENICLVLFLPFVICLIIGFNFLLYNKLDKASLFLMSIISTFLCVMFSIFAFVFSVLQHNVFNVEFPWLNLDELTYSFGLCLDNISALLVLVSSVFAFVLNLFGYLKLADSKHYYKLLLIQNLFLFGLNGLFLSANLFQSYLFCEVVGVASYLMISFDFANREEAKAGIKAFVFNRVGDLSLLFCVLTVLYFSVVYNDLSGTGLVAYSTMNNTVATISSLLPEYLFSLFCAILIFVIAMKFFQVFVCTNFRIKNKDSLFCILASQNFMILLIGLFFVLRLNPFLALLVDNWLFAVLFLFLIFAMLLFARRIFVFVCKLVAFFEKYVVETIVNSAELLIRFLSYLCTRFQAGNFQSYLLYSLLGLIFVFVFVLAFYEILLKV